MYEFEYFRPKSLAEAAELAAVAREFAQREMRQKGKITRRMEMLKTWQTCSAALGSIQ